MTAKALCRVAILGAESSGKSTLAEALALHFKTLWVPEYLREFVDTTGRTPAPHEQIHVAQTQVAREAQAAALPAAQGKLFCDTTPLMTAIYSQYCFGEVDEALAALARSHRYDLTLVAAPDCPWIADGLQRVSDQARQEVYELLLQTLMAHGMPYTIVGGPVTQRVATVAALLAGR